MNSYLLKVKLTTNIIIAVLINYAKVSLNTSAVLYEVSEEYFSITENSLNITDNKILTPNMTAELPIDKRTVFP